MTSDLAAAAEDLRKAFETDVVRPSMLRHLAAYVEGQRHTDITLSCVGEILREYADEIEAQREAHIQSQLAALQAAVDMGTVEGLPDQIPYEGPPLRMVISEQYLRIMLDSMDEGEKLRGRKKVWLKSVRIRRGKLLFEYTTEPEEQK